MNIDVTTTCHVGHGDCKDRERESIVLFYLHTTNQEVSVIRRFITFICMAIVIFTFSAGAQNRWSLELRPGGSFPVKELGDADLTPGFGFEGTVAYRFIGSFCAYAGWGWNRVTADQSFAGPDVRFEETGYVLGVQAMYPFGRSMLKYYVRAGILYNHIETEDSEGEIVDSSPHGLGWQAGAGLAFDITDHLRLTPGLRYRSLSREIDIDNTVVDADLRYLSAGVGIAWRFGRG
ncbi:MAG: outer membrane beta-barrel protein [Chitinivibrionales bacterium]|nr:outer membrane beta-barrel protein [Chitinivibrionales bacterium]